jgi:hypothetical protein
VLVSATSPGKSNQTYFAVSRLIVLRPFFYKQSQAPSYKLGIGSILVCNCIELLIFVFLRFAFKWENKKKEKLRAERGPVTQDDLNATAFQDLTDKQNPNFTYVY